jgi:callose synthase
MLLLFYLFSSGSFFDLSIFLTSQFGFYFSVFTPYYSEIVLYSLAELQKRNEDGISVLFYLQKIFPGLYLLEDILYC